MQYYRPYRLKWTEDSKTFGTGYRIIDAAGNDVDFVTAIAGNDAHARKTQHVAYNIAASKVDAANDPA